MSAPIIPHLDHEMQINHLDDAVAKFVNSEIDYILVTGVRYEERENIIQIQRSSLSSKMYVVVVFGGRGKIGDYAGVVTYDEIKHTMFQYINELEADHGPRTHEQPEKMFIYIGGRNVHHLNMVS